MTPNEVQEPERKIPNANWEYFELYNKIKQAIYSLPLYFKSEISITGINATDIHNLNMVLGATIESHVVETLNDMRTIWDPNNQYMDCGFVRKSQSFPDVLFMRMTEGREDIIFGIELKGWCLLSKEDEPSFRYKVTPSACAIPDLLVIVPWALSNVISGFPQTYTPYVESALYAAQYRNYYWQALRQTEHSTDISHPAGARPYPKMRDRVEDVPEYDGGGNFGRIARTGIMDDYVDSAKQQELCGIQAKFWLTFFKVFRDQQTKERIESELTRITKQWEEANPIFDQFTIDKIKNIVKDVEDIIDHYG